MILARHIPGHITGLDLFPGFIDIFNDQARLLGLKDRVKGIVGSMADIPSFREGIFRPDLVRRSDLQYRL